MARKSNEYVVAPIVNVHIGVSGASRIAVLPSPMKVKSANVVGVPEGTPA